MQVPLVQSFPEVGELLQSVQLVCLPDQASVRWHRPRDGSVVMVLAHEGEDEACTSFLFRLAEQASSLAIWGARPLAVLANLSAKALGLARELPFRVLVDAEGEAHRRWGVGTSQAAVIVADRFGQVYAATDLGEGHDFPRLDDLIEVAKSIGIQCPECGVPDVPNARL